MKNCRVERQCLVLGDFRLPDAEKVIYIVFLYVQNSALYDEVDPPHLPPNWTFLEWISEPTNLKKMVKLRMCRTFFFHLCRRRDSDCDRDRVVSFWFDLLFQIRYTLSD